MIYQKNGCIFFGFIFLRNTRAGMMGNLKRAKLKQ